MTLSDDIKTMLAAAAREHYYGDMKYQTLQIIGAAAGFKSVDVEFVMDGLIVTAIKIYGGERIEFRAS